MALYDCVWMTTATIGTGTITLGTALAGFQTAAAAGVPNAGTVSYRIVDGNNFEYGHGTYTTSGTTLTRGALGGSSGASAISLSGTATVMLTALAEDLTAIVSLNSGTVAPSPTFAQMWWADTGNSLLKMRNQANSAWVTVGTLDATNLGLLSLAGGSLTGVINDAKGEDIASATTTNIGAATGNYIHITGTTTITAFDTIQAGAVRLVKFTGILTLTYNATSLIIPTAANITTAAGDTALFVSLGSGNWECAIFQRASGAALVGSGGNMVNTGASTSGHIPKYTGTSGTALADGYGVDPDTTLAANSDANVPTQKAVRSYVAANAGVSSAEFAALQQDVMQVYLLDSVNGSLAAGQYANGGYDAFNTDTIGANSTNQTYEAGKYYDNPGTGYVQLTPAGSTFGNMTVSPGLAALFDGTTSKNIASSGSYGGNNGYAGKAFSTSTLVSKVVLYSPTGGGFENAGGSTTLTVYGKASLPVSVTDGAVLGSVTFSDAVALVETITFAAASYQYVWCTVSNGASSASRFAQIVYFGPAAPANMTLVSSALSPAPATAPTQIKLMVLYKAIDASTLNTDFTAEGSRDGTTWTAGTLTDTGLTVAGFKVLWTVIDVSGQPSGTTVKYRIKTLNAKTQQVKGVALMFK